MANTFFGLSIGKSGLYAYQAAINTAAHNSSNVHTEGYTRQQVKRSASDPISMAGSYGMAGSGVNADAIVQIRDKYFDEKFWSNKTVYGNYNAKSYYMSSIENYFAETKTEGLTASFDSFFDGLSGLKGDVSDPTKRTGVIEASQTFTQYVNYIANGLSVIQEELNFEIKNTADQINSIAEEIASLTKQINTIEVRGEMANDLRDARNLLIDELSGLANVSVEETVVGDGIGVNQYVVRLDGKIMVDTYNYNTLKVIPNETKVNQDDTDGLYSLQWSNGQNFNSTSPTLGGKLQALFEVRDGNNNSTFNGKATGTAGGNTVTITGSNINNLMQLNIPEEKGLISIDNREYEYTSFDITLGADGKYTYTFHLKDALKESTTADSTAKIGDNVNYKGIPYYMSRLNEFVRTFAKSFNDIHKAGKDAYDNLQNLEYFTGINSGQGNDYCFDDWGVGETISSGVDVTDTETKVNMTYIKGSYYNITASNFSVNKALLDDPKLMACALSDADTDSGAEDAANLDKLLGLRSDSSMFKQGTPAAFLQTFTGEIGVDTKAAKTFEKSQLSILQSIDRQRMSVSGVDSDDEAMDLAKFKNAYDLCSKVISIMNEIYSKLINETGV